MAIEKYRLGREWTNRDNWRTPILKVLRTYEREICCSRVSIPPQFWCFSRSDKQIEKNNEKDIAWETENT